jgi:hypothetical protein
MFALEDGLLVYFAPFFALFSDGSISLNPARPRPAAIRPQLLPNPFLGLRARTQQEPPSPATNGFPEVRGIL